MYEILEESYIIWKTALDPHITKLFLELYSMSYTKYVAEIPNVNAIDNEMSEESKK